jgi:hypothetical protein
MKEELPVFLNVYKIGSFFGLSLFHTAILYDRSEYSYGYHNENNSGVYDIEPMSYDKGMFIESILIGYVNRRKFFISLERIKDEFTGCTYNLLIKNCNHFSNKFCKILFGKDIPIVYNNLITLGDLIRELF